MNNETKISFEELHSELIKMSERKSLIQKLDKLRDIYFELGNDIEEVRMIFEKGLAKLIDIENKMKKDWGYKNE
ncbi:MAG: hypothetical protein ACFFDH_24830 [Promethearchaeota archaeon]